MNPLEHMAFVMDLGFRLGRGERVGLPGVAERGGQVARTVDNEETPMADTMRSKYATADAAWQAKQDAERAVTLLREARALLTKIGATNAARPVGVALKRAQGAANHADRVYIHRYTEQGTA